MMGVGAVSAVDVVVTVVMVMIGGMVMVMAMMPMGGLGRNCKRKKTRGRYKQSH
jgi:hypothetical protein